jgi:hypothetical protein
MILYILCALGAFFVPVLLINAIWWGRRVRTDKIDTLLLAVCCVIYTLTGVLRFHFLPVTLKAWIVIMPLVTIFCLFLLFRKHHQRLLLTGTKGVSIEDVTEYVEKLAKQLGISSFTISNIYNTIDVKIMSPTVTLTRCSNSKYRIFLTKTEEWLTEHGKVNHLHAFIDAANIGFHFSMTTLQCMLIWFEL